VGHQFARATLAAAVTVGGLAACGGGGQQGAPTPVLDNARELVVSTVESTVESIDGGSSAPGTTTGEAPQVSELPAPDGSQYEGANRVVNLWVGPAGETSSIDVWGRRTFTNGPILLVEDLGFGEASGYFSAPPEYNLVIVGAGAGPDADELAGLFNTNDDGQVTTIYTNEDAEGLVWAPNLWEAAADETALAPPPPRPGTGLVVLYAANTRAFDESLTASIGGSSFYVGTGGASCARQRIEEQGFQPNVLGGTQDVQLELPPGTATVSLYPWFSPDECDQPAVIDIPVDVPADGIVLVLVYSRDGRTIETLQLPVMSR
jgi:hypothetical protein